MKKERDGKEHDVYEVSFPVANSCEGAPRANDYEVQIAYVRRGIARVAATKRVYSHGYILGEKMDKDPVLCDFDAEPFASSYMPVRFIVRPANAFGIGGEAISRDFTPDELAKMKA